MLPRELNFVKPLVKNRMRLIALSSGAVYGEIFHPSGDDHLVDRMDKFVGNIDSDDVNDAMDFINSTPYPAFDKERAFRPTVHVDLVLPDKGRDTYHIEERFRSGKSTLCDIRMLNDTATRLHYPVARGLERDLIHHINLLDNEIVNKKNIVPLI
jgi:hypothetical protein